eukprot:320768-Prymnesium_polylepis.1
MASLPCSRWLLAVRVWWCAGVRAAACSFAAFFRSWAGSLVRGRRHACVRARCLRLTPHEDLSVC